MKVALLLALVAFADASCPNQCSGHGRCSKYDKCECYRQGGLSSPYRYAYTGPDCSMRTCPLGRAYDAISTGGAALTPITFEAATTTSAPKLRAYFVPTARTSTDAFKQDQRFVVRVMTVENGGDEGSFTWKFDEDNYYEPESKILAASSEGTARALTKSVNGQTVSTGVYIWFDRSARGTSGFSNNGELAVGDSYSFTLTYNDGINFDSADSNSAHQDTECSGRGVCDYTAGKCKCMDGYTGDACQRTACPNSCSGHGACQSEARFVKDAGVRDAANAVADYSGAYDAMQQYGCKCDAGYRGADCAMIECPSGADPMKGEGGAEGRDCSGRGICDYTAGLCKCFKGFYGERCDLQTNFV